MASLKRRLESDEAAIADLASQVNNLKRFKVGDKTITMREVPSGFPFRAPPQPAAPRVNVNVQSNPTPRTTYAQVREGERQAAMSGYKMSFPRVNYNPSISVSPSQGYRSRMPFLKKKAASDAKARSKASLARARMSAKKGGTAIPKRTLLKAAKQADNMLAYRMWMKQTKARLLAALKSRNKSVLAMCLANS